MSARSHKATGNPKGRPPSMKNLPPSDIQEIPETPKKFGEDGKKMWEAIWGAGATYLVNSDRILIEELCEIFEEKEYLRRMIATGEIPRWVRIPSGSLQPHPAIGMLSNLRQSFELKLSKCGLTPVDRARLNVMEDAVAAEIKNMFTERENRRAANS